MTTAPHATIPVRSADGAATVVEAFGSHGTPVLFLPALGVPLHYYRPLLGRWAEGGYRIFGLELRGMPQSSTADIRSTDFGYNDALEFDVPAAIAQTPLASAGPIVLAGHSLGGQLSLLYAAAHPGDAAAVVTLASGSSHHSALSGIAARLKRRLQVRAVRRVTAILGYFPGDRMGFAGRQPRSMMADWAFEGRHGKYRLAGSTADHEGGLAALRTPVLMLTLDGDRIMPAESAALLGARLAVAPLTTTHVDRRENGGEAFDHFRWARRNPDAVLTPVTSWLAGILR